MAVSNSTARFSDRVENYIKYRPDYPAALFDFLTNELKWSAGTTVADMGSGTGIFTEALLVRGLRVYAVEPNLPMREAAERLLANQPKFHSVAAPAEATTLPDESIHGIVAAQAFHWFDVEKIRAEWRRILQKDGQVVLVWNERSDIASEFLRGYEELLQKFGTDYAQVKHQHVESDGAIARFFAPAPYKIFSCPHEQRFDLVGLTGRLLSSSYAPAAGHPAHAPMLEALGKLFAQHAQAGRVTFAYQTKAFYGSPARR